MRRLVGGQVAGFRRALPTAQKDIVAVGEGAGAEHLRHFRQLGVGVEPHRGKVDAGGNAQ